MVSRPKQRRIRISKDDRLRMATNGRCWYCGTRLSPRDMTRDHQVPRCQGGPSTLANLVCCCVGCNQRKGAMTVDQFRDRHFAGEVFWGEVVAESREDPPLSYSVDQYRDGS